MRHVLMRQVRTLASKVVALVGVGALFAAVGLSPASAATSNLSLTVDQTYQTNGRVAAILSVGNTLYLAGSFTSMRPYGAAPGTGEVTRNHFAALDKTSGQLLPWDPNSDKEGYALAVAPDGSSIYVGGLFTTLGGVHQGRIAAVSPTTGAVIASWKPSVNGKVRTVIVDTQRVYLGGTFTTVNGQMIAELTAVSPTSGAIDPTWHAALNSAVQVLMFSPDGASIYAGGHFTTVNGDVTQKHLVRLSIVNAAVQEISFHPGWPVSSLAASGSSLIVAGNGAGGNAASEALSTGAKQWTIQTDGGIQAVTILGGLAYLGGHFDNMCTATGTPQSTTTGFKCPQLVTTRHKLLAVDAATGTLDPWNPGANTPLGVFALNNINGSLQVGGDFTKLGQPDSLGQATWQQQGYGQFSATAG